MQTQNESVDLNRHVSLNFLAKEFACPCCGEEGFKEELIEKLQLARNNLRPKSAIVINSGYRCEKHNKEVGGVVGSSHRKGLAVDIRCDHSSYRFSLIRALIGAGFKRIGIGEDFIHCDLDLEKPQNVIWDYY